MNSDTVNENLNTMDFHTNHGEIRQLLDTWPGFGEQEAKPASYFTPWRAGPEPYWISS